MLAATCSTAWERPAADFGPELPIIGRLQVGPCMDAAVYGDHLFAVGGGKLFSFDIRQPKSPRLLGQLAGLGHVRQIDVVDGVAYVTAREDGLFIVDVTRPDDPRQLAHYDTIELATGIDISGNVAFIACRQCGVELVDVSRKTAPEHLSTIRVGEAQSVVSRNGILYAGVWASRELVICDVRNPRQPKVLARAPLDGYGDGVDVRGRYCYVATGHHSRQTPRSQPGDPGFGHGHGLEIFDVADPSRPRFISRVKMPPWYRIGMDMWDVVALDGYAIVADTYNGLFVVDTSRPNVPLVVAHRRLPIVPSREGDPSPLAGLAVGDGVVYAAGAWTDLHLIDAEGLARRVKSEPDLSPEIPQDSYSPSSKKYRVYRPQGQVHAVALQDNAALAAAGNGGLHAVEIQPEFQTLAVYPTNGFAMDVTTNGGLVYVAEGRGGLSVWRGPPESLRLIGRYDSRGQAVRQVVVPGDGKYACIHVGSSHLEILDVSDPAAPKRVLRDSHPGLLYFNPIAEGSLAGRYVCCHWHVSGLHWYDLYGEQGPAYAQLNYAHRIGSLNGVAYYKGQALVTLRRKFALMAPDEMRPPDKLPLYGVQQLRLEGKPSVVEDTLFVSDRYSGHVTALDIATIDRPRAIGTLALPEHPGIVVAHNDLALIPAGYQGLLAWRFRRADAGSRDRQ